MTQVLPSRFFLAVSIVGLLACTFFLTGCEAGCPWTEDEVPTIDSFEASPATVAPGDEIELAFEVSFFELTGEADHHDHGEDEEGSHDDHAAENPCPNGHVHVYLDDLMTDPLGMPTSSTATVELPLDTAAGQHTLIARLHSADHTILRVGDAEVTAELVITVEDVAVPAL
ncbi:MAG: hypothetical protein VX498_11625 [Myxococcota bacterium]|nr:hypothetical protein [Myxococcota bacterium]